MASAPPAPFDLELGTREHYQDAALYDHEYRQRRADVNFYREAARAHGGPVLELGCGSGRILVALVRDGHRVIGLDLSAPMLARARSRLLRLPPRVRVRALLLRADMRRFALSPSARFPLVIAPFNTLQHLYHPDAMLRCLSCVRAHLGSSGRFVFDVLNPDPRWLARDDGRRWGRTRFRHPSDGRTYWYSTNHHYDAARQIAFVHLYYEPDGPGAERVVRLAHRLFFPRELEALLRLGGFRLIERSGGFLGEPLDNHARLQVCVASPDGK
jgi:SAM-dependent methyltransferase